MQELVTIAICAFVLAFCYYMLDKDDREGVRLIGSVVLMVIAFAMLCYSVERLLSPQEPTLAPPKATVTNPNVIEVPFEYEIKQ
jgi:hypothetical protein